MLNSLLTRFKEPSSWAGVTGLAGLVGIHLDPGMTQSLMYLGAGAAGLLAFFLPERKQ